MKRLLLFSFILIADILIYSCGQEEASVEELHEIQINLLGQWQAERYMCQMQFFTETISIHHDEQTGVVIATKVTGDPCVPAGDETFRGNYDGYAKKFIVIWVGGSPQSPSSDSYPGSVQVHSSTSMTVMLANDMEFTKMN